MFPIINYTGSLFICNGLTGITVFKIQVNLTHLIIDR